jgi:hypothetical protein
MTSAKFTKSDMTVSLSAEFIKNKPTK